MQRIEWIDAYRGLMIFLIVTLHMELPVSLFDGVRIPAFFFISGFLFSRKYTTFTPFFSKRFKQIVIPYLFYFYLLLGLAFIILYTKHESLDVLAATKAMLYGTFSWDMHYAKSLWFVTALFTTEMLFFLTRYFLKKDCFVIFALMIYFVLGYLTHFLSFRLPWGLDVALMLVGFYGIGYYVKQFNLINYIRIRQPLMQLCVAILLLLASYYVSIGPYTFVLNKITNYPFMVISAVLGIFSVLMFMQFEILGKNKALEFLGQNSYVILAFHELFLYSSQKIIKMLWHVDRVDMHQFSIVVVYLLLMGIQLIVTALLLKRLFPFLQR